MTWNLLLDYFFTTSIIKIIKRNITTLNNHNPFMIHFSQIFAQNKNISINGMLSLTFNEDLMQFGLSMNISEFLRGKHKKTSRLGIFLIYFGLNYVTINDAQQFLENF